MYTIEAGSGTIGDPWGGCITGDFVARVDSGALVAHRFGELCEGEHRWTFSQQDVDKVGEGVPGVSGQYWTVENNPWGMYLDFDVTGRLGVRSQMLGPGARFYGTHCADPASFVAHFKRRIPNEADSLEDPQQGSWQEMTIEGPTSCTFRTIWTITQDDVDSASPRFRT